MHMHMPSPETTLCVRQKPDDVKAMVHLLTESFTAFHIDANEHKQALKRMTQLSLGIPLGCLVNETAGLVIPGAKNIFSFSTLRGTASADVHADAPSAAASSASTAAPADTSTGDELVQVVDTLEEEAKKGNETAAKEHKNKPDQKRSKGNGKGKAPTSDTSDEVSPPNL